MAPDEMASSQIAIDRDLFSADPLNVSATGMKRASGRRVHRTGNISFK
jgi:hypothetical protein